MRNSYIEGLEPNASKWMREDSERAAKSFEETSVVDGIVKWISNNDFPSKDLLVFWNHIGKDFDLEATLNAREESTRAFLKSYKNRKVSDEERFEIKSAFGNEKVIDIITGKEVK